jgi:hypothetical protein
MNIEQWRIHIEDIPKTKEELIERIQQHKKIESILQDKKKDKIIFYNKVLEHDLNIPGGSSKIITQFYKIISTYNHKELYYPYVDCTTVRHEVKKICYHNNINRPQIDKIICYLQGLYVLGYTRPIEPRIIKRDFDMQKEEILIEYDRLKKEVFDLEKELSRI